MRRRTFIKAVVGSFSAWPIVVRAQQPTPVIGFMHAGVADRFVKPIIAFRKGLSEAGFEEGRNVSIEYRWADGHYDRLPGMAADLISRKVAVLVAAPTAATLAAKAATSTIPIVFELGIDPVASGIVASLNRPGGNITGVMNLATALIGKRIEVPNSAEFQSHSRIAKSGQSRRSRCRNYQRACEPRAAWDKARILGGKHISRHRSCICQGGRIKSWRPSCEL